MILDDFPSQCYITINKHNYRPFIIHYDETSGYIQNTNIENYSYYHKSGSIAVGNHVNPNVTYGDVIVKNGGTLKINATSGVTFDTGFKCEIGGTLLLE